MITEVATEQWDKIKIGVDKIADAVKSTLGPGGQGVVISHRRAMPFITKDGVTVAQHVFLEDPIENIGAQLVKEVANRTVDGAGDGTTTATVLAQAIFNIGLVSIKSGVNPVEMKAGIDLAVKHIVDQLKAQSKPVKDRELIKQVATISANYDEEIGNMIADAITEIGDNGYIAAEESNGTETYVKISKGMQLERGYLSPHFINNVEKMLVEYKNPAILITDKRISTVQDLLPALEVSNGQPLLIIADDVDQEALATLVINKKKGILQVCAIRCPYMLGHKNTLLEDIAILTGGTVVSEEAGYSLQKIDPSYLGSCESLTVSKDTTVIVAGKGSQESRDSRIGQIKQEIENSRSEKEIFMLKSRLAKIDGGVAIIHVGGPTETAAKERKFRVDDAILATIAATEEGIVSGGGIAYLNCSTTGLELKNSSDDMIRGVDIVFEAIRQPIKVIADNVGEPSKTVINHIKNKVYIPEEHVDIPTYGWDAKRNVYGSMLEMGIIDPAKVSRLALENAASIMGLLLNTKANIYEKVSEFSMGEQ